MGWTTWRRTGGGPGDLYVGGHLTSAGGVQTSKIAKWDGATWCSLGEGLSRIVINDFPPYQQINVARVDSLLAHGGNLVVGGGFNMASAVAATNVAVWDGFQWSALGEGLRGGAVRSLAALGQGLYAGGGFTSRADEPLSRIARWDGQRWTDVGGGVGDGSIQVLATDSRNLYAGGTFRLIGGIEANRIAKWDGSAWSPLGSGIEPGVVALASNGSELFAGGTFYSAGGAPAANLALWHIPQTLNLEATANALTISWPAPDTNFVLEASHSCAEPDWSEVPQSPALINHRWTITTNTSGPTTFFRLRQN